ncbi:hypothetical protein H2200_009837 [Cladophialophora chaetospira]|uniref:Transcription factor domain-containing protein n=1 Tax=Cladophialophora chaetospira TaxID=386627 RepID=A0AA38X365_9EURO|nr:hypothetical protein H2200_009837 [Cladophialophora chaetospira]
MPAKPATPAQPSTRLLQALVLNAISLFRRNDARSVTFIEAFELALGVFGRVGIEASDTEASSAHDREVRRRCWWTLRKLNDQLILATGSERGELASISDVAVPLNINDIDLTLAMDEMPTARTGSTAMSFYLVNLKAIQLTAALKLLGGAGHPSKSIRSVQLRRRSLVENAVGEIEREFLRHCDTSRPLDWFLMLTTKAILNPIEIMMLDEGMEQPKCTGAVTQDSKEDQKFLLRLDVVECWHLLKSNENLKSWRWFLDTLAQAFTVGDLQADLVKHPESAYSDRAYELIKLISHG